MKLCHVLHKTFSIFTPTIRNLLLWPHKSRVQNESAAGSQSLRAVRTNTVTIRRNILNCVYTCIGRFVSCLTSCVKYYNYKLKNGDDVSRGLRITQEEISNYIYIYIYIHIYHVYMSLENFKRDLRKIVASSRNPSENNIKNRLKTLLIQYYNIYGSP
jgi:hypothetical protein